MFMTIICSDAEAANERTRDTCLLSYTHSSNATLS